MREKTTLKFHRISVSLFFRRILLSWLMAVAVEYFLLPAELRNLSGLEGLERMSLLRVTLLTCSLSATLLGLSFWKPCPHMERWAIAGILGTVLLAALCSSFSWSFLAACLLMVLLAVCYALEGWNQRPESVPVNRKCKALWHWLTAGLTLLFFLFVSIWTVSRVYSFSTPTYDMGIFSQMFYNMRETGQPITTVERDGALCHFAVHMSPIYYLMLPIYWLFPYPATLQVLQAAVISSAVIPLWKIGRQKGLSGVQRTLLCSLLLLYPAFSGGTSYDIHENCFLTPLLLWLFYGIDRRNSFLTAAAALLTLTVKEDAAVYVAVIALWLSTRTVLRFQKSNIRDLITGLALLVVSLGWFFAVTGYLAKNGDGVMTYRYRNFMYDGSSSLITVIKSVILNPMKTVYECADPEKLYFIAMTILPLLGLPLLTRRYERYILLIPYVLVNLMSDYRYQHDIFFQYTFGSTAFLLYLTVVNLADWRIDRTRTAALFLTAAVAAGCFGVAVVPKAMRYPLRAVQNYEYNQSLRRVLSEIPEQATVTASTFYTTYLSQREILYDLRYCAQEHLLETEYVVLDPYAKSDFKPYETTVSGNGYENLLQLLEQEGYQLWQEFGDRLVIYYREPA